jgi:hypothetical protein
MIKIEVVEKNETYQPSIVSARVGAKFLHPVIPQRSLQSFPKILQWQSEHHLHRPYHLLKKVKVPEKELYIEISILNRD